MSKAKELTGQRFGNLTVIKRVESNKDGRAQWLCKCDCGNECIATGKSLINGSKKSCGCYQKYKPSHKMYNNYYVIGELVYVQYRNSYDCFIIDKECLDEIKDMCWHNTADYPYSKINGKSCALSRLIMNCPEDMEVDHINGKPWDNRKCNLRVVTRSQNGMNTGTRISNTSGYKGVVWYKSRSKWMAQITFNNKRYFLGYFDDINDAINARKEAELKYFGEYSREYGDLHE